MTYEKASLIEQIWRIEKIEKNASIRFIASLNTN